MAENGREVGGGLLVKGGLRYEWRDDSFYFAGGYMCMLLQVQLECAVL